MLISCTLILALAMILGTVVYLQTTEWKRTLAPTRTAAALMEAYINAARSERDAVGQMFGDLNMALSNLQGADGQTAAAILAISERMARNEEAMKAAIAQMVNVSGWTAEKHQQTIAAALRGQQGKRPGVGA